MLHLDTFAPNILTDDKLKSVRVELERSQLRFISIRTILNLLDPDQVFA